MPERSPGENLVEVTLQIDEEALKEMERLKALLKSPNLTTAIYNAVSLANTLYDYQSQGYKLSVAKNGDTHRFQLPS